MSAAEKGAIYSYAESTICVTFDPLGLEPSQRDATEFFLQLTFPGTHVEPGSVAVSLSISGHPGFSGRRNHDKLACDLRLEDLPRLRDVLTEAIEKAKAQGWPAQVATS